jgi:hypothetical protein
VILTKPFYKTTKLKSSRSKEKLRLLITQTYLLVLNLDLSQEASSTKKAIITAVLIKVAQVINPCFWKVKGVTTTWQV